MFLGSWATRIGWISYWCQSVRGCLCLSQYRSAVSDLWLQPRHQPLKNRRSYEGDRGFGLRDVPGMPGMELSDSSLKNESRTRAVAVKARNYYTSIMRPVRARSRSKTSGARVLSEGNASHNLVCIVWLAIDTHHGGKIVTNTSPILKFNWHNRLTAAWYPWFAWAFYDNQHATCKNCVEFSDLFWELCNSFIEERFRACTKWISIERYVAWTLRLPTVKNENCQLRVVEGCWQRA